MYIIVMPNGLYVRKGGGCNDFVQDARHATQFPDKESARAAKPGHHKDMGGTGYKGRVVKAEPEIRYSRHRFGERY